MRLTHMLAGAAIAAVLSACAVIPTARGPAFVPLLPPPPPIGWYQPVPIEPMYPDFGLMMPPAIVLRGPYGVPMPVPNFPQNFMIR